MSEYSFPCTGCGSCCRRIDAAVRHSNVKSAKDPLYFPYTWDEKGVCENLTEDNRCKVYENRPLLCNIEKYAAYMKLDKTEFYQANARACNFLMDIDKIPASFRISTADMTFPQ